MKPQAILDNHRFLDEAGDTTFYAKGKVPIIGQAGVSQCFILGMVKFREPLLNVADYFCWSIQRVFERGEVRFYNFLKDRVSLVVDLYDSKNYRNSQNYYKPQKPLTAHNKV